MISANDIYNISTLLSGMFFYGLANDYSSSSIEERISHSQVISDLENGDSSFLHHKQSDEIVKTIYHLPEDTYILAETNVLSLWLGEIYTKLFFIKNKSFSYLFLYLPLDRAIWAFDIYHEMDFNQLLNLFNDFEKKNTILSLLLKKRNIKIRELSALTRININTIVSYTRSNENIYAAKYQAIYDISSVLRVNPNIFIRRINNYTNSEMYIFDKTNPIYRLYLAYYLACYFDSDIASAKYEQLEDNKLVNENSIFIAIWTDPAKEGLYTPNKNEDIIRLVMDYQTNHQDINKTILVVFEFNQTSDKLDYYLKLKEQGFYKIIIINQLYYFMISESKQYRKEILDFVNQICIKNAKEKALGDFAI